MDLCASSILKVINFIWSQSLCVACRRLKYWCCILPLWRKLCHLSFGIGAKFVNVKKRFGGPKEVWLLFRELCSLPVFPLSQIGQQFWGFCSVIFPCSQWCICSAGVFCSYLPSFSLGLEEGPTEDRKEISSANKSSFEEGITSREAAAFSLQIAPLWLFFPTDDSKCNGFHWGAVGRKGVNQPLPRPTLLCYKSPLHPDVLFFLSIRTELDCICGKCVLSFCDLDRIWLSEWGQYVWGIDGQHCPGWQLIFTGPTLWIEIAWKGQIYWLDQQTC